MEIKIRHQHRHNLMMRPVRGGIEVFVPLWLGKDSPPVTRFIEQGIRQLRDKIPPHLPQQITPEQLRSMVHDWAARMDVAPGRITLRAMQRKWGSCSSGRNITLNTALLGVPHALAEYVVVHELVHLRVFNHGPAFKAEMSRYLPDWRTREYQLNQYHP